MDNLTDQDDFDRVAAAVLSKRRIAQLAERDITVNASPCPCYLRDSRGNLHRRRHSDERPGLCYLERGGSGRGMADHVRGWFRARKLIAYTLEPYHEVDAAAFGAASQALAEDDLVITRKEDELPTHLITSL